MKILLLSDSVALPRVTPEHTSMEETWPVLLRKAGYEVIQCSIGAATSTDILRQSNYYSLSCLNVDHVLVQCGIVDCAPRFVKKWEHAFVKGIPYFGRKILKALNKRSIRQLRNITYTNQAQFRKNVALLNRVYKDRLYFISIIPANAEYEKSLAGVSKNIAAYNDILRCDGKVIEIFGVEQHGVMSDGHHLNREGHLFVYDKVKSHLENVVSQ